MNKWTHRVIAAMDKKMAAKRVVVTVKDRKALMNIIAEIDERVAQLSALLKHPKVRAYRKKPGKIIPIEWVHVQQILDCAVALHKKFGEELLRSVERA